MTISGLYQNQKVVILQSGFLCTNLEILEKGKVEKPNFSDIVLVKSHLKLDEVNYYSKEAQRLYEEYCSDASLMKKFDFREQILKFAFLLFSEQNIRNWILLQKKSIYFTELHRAFVIQTLQYINGTDRPVHVTQWFNLLNCSEASKDMNLDLDSYLDRDNSIKNMNSDIYDVMNKWTSRPGGFADLLTSMHAIYGQRKTITSMANHKE